MVRIARYGASAPGNRFDASRQPRRDCHRATPISTLRVSIPLSCTLGGYHSAGVDRALRLRRFRWAGASVRWVRLPTQGAHGFARRIHFHHSQLLGRLRRGARLLTFLGTGRFAFARFAPFFRLELARRRAGRFCLGGFPDLRAVEDCVDPSRCRSSTTSSSMRACTSACSRPTARDRSFFRAASRRERRARASASDFSAVIRLRWSS